MSSSGRRASGGPTLTTGQVPLTASTPTLIIAANPARRAVMIRNLDASSDAYYGPSGVTNFTGMLIKAGTSPESREIPTTAAVYGYSAGTPRIAYEEVAD